MKIGFDAKRAFHNNTGLGNYSRDTIRVLGTYYPQHQYLLYTPKAKVNQRLQFLKDIKNINIRTPKSIMYQSFSGIWRSVTLSKQLHKDQIDVFHGLSHELPKGIQKTTIKTVVTIHDLIFIRYPNFFKSIDRKIYYHKFKHACHVADHIIAVSKQTKADIMEFFSIPEEKITVVYQGCNQVFQKKSKDSEVIKNKYNLPNKYLLCVGSIEERKNLLTLLKTMKSLPSHHLLVIGTGKKYKRDCIKFVQENKMKERIHFLEGISLTDMAAIYQSAEIMIYPSVFEGFGIPIIEALFSKTPVITTNGGCFNESGGPSSYYINPLESDSIAEAIKHIQSDNELKNKMINDGFKYAQNFTDDKIAKKLMTLYQSL